MAAAMAVAALVGTSAFADSRPADETRGRGSEGSVVRRTTAAAREAARSGDESRNTTRADAAESRRERVAAPQSDRGRESYRDRVADSGRREAARERSERSRDNDNRGRNESYRDNDRRRNDSYRDRIAERGRDAARNHDGRYRDRDHDRNRRSYRDRQHYHARGRISQVRRYGNGYRVWVAGSPYPFFVPAAHYHRDRFRVGIVIGLGGYYNPHGYYDYGYYGDRRYSNGVLRGVVESVDYRRDTFVIRNEATGSFVTVVSRDRRGDVRPGDFVEISGDWSRSGLFEAWDVDLLDYAYRR